MASASADRNLLFGILALQLDFIRSDQLVNAMHTWVLNKTRALGDILIEKESLTHEQGLLLSELVTEHLKVHGHDPQKSLAAVHPPNSVYANLDHIQDTDVAASLTLLPSDHTVSCGDMVSIGRAETTRSSTRFRVLRPHDEGGLGRVSVAMDEELHREVALKEIKQEFLHNAALRARFLLEAEITGSLEHPGVVPVYGLGHYADGRPYYAMRFIRGDSFREAISRYHKQNWNRRNSSERWLHLRRLLSRFLDVCNAVHYAHRRGILHRDLKPGNIMLGEYGETLVVDWGLAKILGQGHSAADDNNAVVSTLHPQSDNNGAATRQGTLIGSPPYMSPEQARGDHDRLGVESDIYSLGATLYTLLTNAAPVSGSSQEDIVAKVRAGQIQPPRQIKKETPRTLEAICCKAMALNPIDRYPNARSLADDVERFLADDPLSCYREGILERASRLIRRYRTSAIWFVASLTVITVLSVTATLVVYRARQATETALAAEQVARAEAIDQSAVAEQSMTVLVETLRSPDPWLDGREVKVVDVLQRRVESLRTDPSLHWQVRGRLLTALGNTYTNLGLFEDAIPLLEEAHKTIKERGSDIDVDSLRTANALAVAYHKAGRTKDAMTLYEYCFDLAVQRYGRTHPETLVCMNNLANGLQDTERSTEALDLFKEGVRARSRLLGDRHPQTLNSLNSLSCALLEEKMPREAMPFAEQALKGREDLYGRAHPLTLTSLSIYASILSDLGKVADSIPLLEEVYQGRVRELGPDHSETIEAMDNLGAIYMRAGRTHEAIPLLSIAYEKRHAKLGPDHRETIMVTHTLGRAYDEIGETSKAIPLLRQVAEWNRRERGEDNRSTLGSINSLALALKRHGRLDEAIPLYEDIVRLGTRQLGQEDLDVLNYRNNLARAYHETGRVTEAIPILQDVMMRRKRILGMEHQDTLTSMNNLALAFLDDAKPAEAIALLEAVVELGAEAYGATHPYQLLSITSLGRAYLERDQPERAEELLAENWPRMQAEFTSRHRPALVNGLLLGESLVRLEEWERAEEVLTEVAADFEAEFPDEYLSAQARGLLGAVFLARGRYPEAEPLLVDSAARLLEQQHEIPAARRDRLLSQSIDRVIKVYEALRRPDDARRWRERQLNEREVLP